MMTHRPRLPLDALGPFLDAHAAAHAPTLAHGRAWALARLAGTGQRTAQRMIAEGAVIEHHADRAAIALGLHPVLIWPDEWAALDPTTDLPPKEHAA